MNTTPATIVHEYGPFPGIEAVHGVTYDGHHVWFASGERLNAFDPASGRILRSINVAADAGTAFDGRHLFQIAERRIQKIDPMTGRVLATIPAPGNGGDSGLTWAEGTLWVGQYRDRKIHQIDPETGAILRTIESNRFVTGVTWVEGDLWHGTWESDESELRRGSTPEPERSWRPSRCRPTWAYRGSSPAAATGSSAAAETAARCEPSAGRSADSGARSLPHWTASFQLAQAHERAGISRSGRQRKTPGVATGRFAFRAGRDRLMPPPAARPGRPRDRCPGPWQRCHARRTRSRPSRPCRRSGSPTSGRAGSRHCAWSSAVRAW